MQIYGLEKLSLVDYKSYACAVVFTGGCNFRCPFCHNRGLVEKEVLPLKINEVLEYLQARRGLLDAVCISGGEPTLHEDLLDFIAEIKQMGYKVKLDTNGTNPTMLQTAIDRKLVDYVAMDIKNCFEKYPATIGLERVNIVDIRKSIDILLQNKVEYEFRTTLVQEFHTEESIIKMSKELTGATCLYLQRFVSNENCINEDLSAIPQDQALSLAKILAQNIDNVKLRGY